MVLHSIQTHLWRASAVQELKLLPCLCESTVCWCSVPCVIADSDQTKAFMSMLQVLKEGGLILHLGAVPPIQNKLAC